MDMLVLQPLLDMLQPLVAVPSVSGDERGLDLGAEEVARLCRAAGLRTSIHPTEGAPIVLAQRKGASSRHLLFYDHYDVAPPGMRREWHHQPFTLAERDNRLYGRGVASDKANLVARLAAVQRLIAQDNLPASVSFIIEGDALLGSPHLPALIADQASQLHGDLMLGAGGSTDGKHIPYVYAGVRGRLAIWMRTQKLATALPPEFAVSVPNAAWRLIWAVNQIKNDNEEVLIEGFYDTVVAPAREANALVRQMQFDEAARLEAWGLKEFLFGMSGPALARAEIFSPTCNISAFQAGAGNLPALPHQAEVLLDFTLVPEQRPNEILRLLRLHLDERGFSDVELAPLPGAYPPALTSLAAPALGFLAEQIELAYGRSPQVVPLASFAQPLHLFTAGMNIPALPLGLSHAGAVVRGPNEWIDASALQAMTTFVEQLILAFATSERDLRLVP